LSRPRAPRGRGPSVYLLIGLGVFSSLAAQDPKWPALKTIIIDHYAPYTFLDVQGRPAGFSVDLIRAVARTMGDELEIEVDAWDRARLALESGEIDLLPMMAYSTERDRLYDFSPPHTIAYDAFFERKGGGLVRSVNDLAGKSAIVKSTGEYRRIYDTWFQALEPRGLPTSFLKYFGLSALAAALVGAILLAGLVTLRRQVEVRTKSLRQEIEARALTENLLKDNQELLDETGKMAKVGGWAIDLEKNELSWTKETYAIHEVGDDFQPTVEKAIGFYSDASKDPITEAVARAVNRGEAFDLELEIVTAGGKAVPVHALGKAVMADGKVSRIVGAFQDITERKRAEGEILKLNADLERRVALRTAQLETANKELEAFSYTVSHDLRAPLRHIDGYIDLLVSRFRPELPEKALHYLDSIVESTRQMGILIDGLLRFSKIGRTEIAFESIDMNQVVREALDILKVIQAGRSVEWEIGELPAASGDRTLLRQVWVNLIENAIKYTREREPARIGISAMEGAGENVYSVEDNGAGFDMRYADKLFGVFQRLHSDERFEGTGIGLASVQRIVSRHGGRAWADAEPGKGAIFHFSLPKAEGGRP
jgi:signal transduction histidine kinase